MIAYQDVSALTLRVQAAVILPDGRATALRLLEISTVPADRSVSITGPRIRAILDHDGATTVAWTGIAAGGYAIRAQRVPGGAPATTLSDTEDLTLQDLTSDAQGRAALLGTRGPQRVMGTELSGSRIVVSLRAAADAPFGVPSRVFDSADGVYAARGALNRAGTRLAVIWSSGADTGPSGPVLLSELSDPVGAP